MKIVIALLIGFFAWTDANLWTYDFDKAKEIAKTEKKLILVSFSGSDWCGPCIKLKSEVLENPVFQNFAKEKLIMVKADFPRLKKNQLDAKQVEKNEKLADKYNSKGKFPFTVLVNPDGKVLKEWDGYPKDLDQVKLRTEISGFIK